MNILITSGSTIDYIDNLNFVGNANNGLFGSLIGEELSKNRGVEKVFYICGKESRFPWQHFSQNDQKFFLEEWLDKIAVYQVHDIEHLNATVVDIFNEYKIDAVLHTMSISNYGNSKVHLLGNGKDAKQLIEHIGKLFDLEVTIKGDTSGEVNEKVRGGKIVSGFPHLFIEQSPVRKMMKMFKEISPDTLLFSSKFEKGISDDDIIHFASDSLKRNDSDFVLASDITDKKKSFLVHKDEKVDRFSSVEQFSSFLISLINENKK